MTQATELRAAMAVAASLTAAIFVLPAQAGAARYADRHAASSFATVVQPGETARK